MNEKYRTYNIGVEQSLGPFGFRHFISKIEPHGSVVNNGIERPLFFLNLMHKMLDAFLTSEIKGFQGKISFAKIVKKLRAFLLRLFWWLSGGKKELALRYFFQELKSQRLSESSVSAGH